MKHQRMLFMLLVAMVICLLAFTACNNNTTPPPAQNQTGEQNTSKQLAEAEKKVIGMVVKYASMEFIQAFIVGATETCDELGIELRIVDAEADSLKIMNAISNFIVQGIDGFILAGAEDLVTLVPGIEELNREGIPVMAIDTCPEGGHVDMFITFDLVDSSRKAAEQMIKGLKEAHGGQVPTGTVIEITGSLVDMFTTDCHTGFSSVLDQYPQLTVVQGEGHWNNDDSYNRTSDLLTRYGDDVVAVYVHTPDIMGAGAVAAIESAGKNPGDYFISGICLGVEGLELMKAGKLYAVVEQPALDSAIKAVRYLDMMFKGQAIPKIGDTVVEEGALWSPAYVIENEYADSGATMILQAPLVPQDADVNNPLLWENRI